MNKPKVTIITATWNSAATLQQCLDSIRNQSYANIEFIVMDGDSSDGTQDILAANNDMITYWESKKDCGIYHAWNKALKHATGDWICFLGSDDYWAYSNAVEDMLDVGDKQEINFISGKLAYVDAKGVVKSEYGKPWSWKAIKRSHCIAHPGALFHKSIFDTFGEFDESYRIAADYEFSLRLGEYVQDAYVNKVLVYMGDSGVSQSHISTVLTETWRAQSKHVEVGKLKATYIFLRTYTIITIKRILGKF